MSKLRDELHAPADGEGMGMTIVQLSQPDLVSDSETDGIRQSERRDQERCQFKIRVASSTRARHEAGRLLQERYEHRGYGIPEMRVDPSRMTIVVYDGACAVGTLSIGFDSVDGLLCDDLYRRELDELRNQGKLLCEFTKLAINASGRFSTAILAALMHVAFLYGHKIRQADSLVFEVNPRHVKFYQRALGLSQIGPQRMNRRVNAPAVLIGAEFSYIEAQIEHCANAAVNKEKSFYPYSFSQQEAHGILQRLIRMQSATAGREACVHDHFFL